MCRIEGGDGGPFERRLLRSLLTHMLLRVYPRQRPPIGSFATSLCLCAVLVSAKQAWAAAPEGARDFAAASTQPDSAEKDVHSQAGTVSDAAAAASAIENAHLGNVYQPRFWIVDPRTRASKPQPDLMKFEIHGDYLAGYTRVPNLPLTNYGFADYRSNLGQSQRLEHRMRFKPHFSFRSNLAITAQFDVPHGMLLGQTMDHVAGDPSPMSEAQPMQFAFRWLYADIFFGGGQLRIGQQPARWGSGLVFDSGDERQTFGDPRFGTVVERVAYLGKPFGANSKFELLLATDWVYSDARMHWPDGDRDLRAVAGFSYVESPQRRIGAMLVGEKYQPHIGNAELAARRPTETTSTLDLAGETALPVPGQSAYIVAAGEAAVVLGRSDVAPEVIAGPNARVQRVGALARLGAVGVRGTGSRRWGKWGVLFEWGYSSADSDPSDGVDRRFVSNPSRRVGLILFDEVLRWKSARAAAALEDARIGMRPTASATNLATAGGVSGATYFSLQWLFRPMPNFDLRAAALLAQTSGDFVDPARLVIQGRWTNYDGGNPIHRDLGLELDAATEYRQPLDNGLGLLFGVEAGLLLPGRALADSRGESMRTLGLARGRFGFYF